MKYIVLYDTIINKTHTPKDTEIVFEAGTDEGYIKRLLANEVIAPIESSTESKPKILKRKSQKSPKASPRKHKRTQSDRL